MTNKEKVEFVKRNFDDLVGMVCSMENGSYHSAFPKEKPVRIIQADRRNNRDAEPMTLTGAVTEASIEMRISEEPNVNKNYEVLVALLHDNNVCVWTKIKELTFIPSTKEEIEISQKSLKEKVEKLEEYKLFIEMNKLSKFNPVEYFIKSLMKDLNSSDSKIEETLLKSVDLEQIYSNYFQIST